MAAPRPPSPAPVAQLQLRIDLFPAAAAAAPPFHPSRPKRKSAQLATFLLQEQALASLEGASRAKKPKQTRIDNDVDQEYEIARIVQQRAGQDGEECELLVHWGAVGQIAPGSR
jgi:hypothetical protein